MPVPAAAVLDTAVFWSHMSVVLQQTCRLVQLMSRQLAGFYQFCQTVTPRHFQTEIQMERLV